MPAADLRIYDNPPQTTNLEGICVRHDVFDTNYKGEEKASIRKRSEKILQKLQPALQRMLLPEEAVLSVMQARSPLSLIEQITAAWWTAALAACVVVVTNRRILFLPVKRDGSWKESVRAVQWGDIEEIKPKGLLTRNVSFRFKDGAKVTYTNFRRVDARKIEAIAGVLIPAASGELSSAQGMVQLCPDCRNVLTPGQYSCSACGLIFKNEKSMVTRSILLPAGGYFYTGHPLIALLPAIFEGLLVLDILVLLFAGLASPKAMPQVRAALFVLGFFWALETAITILHCRRYIRDFIPEKRDPTRAQQSVPAAIGR